MTVLAMVPIMGGLAVGIDFTEMSRQRQATQNALDAAGIATGQRFRQGGTDEEIKAYAKDFFEANLGPVDPANTQFKVFLPEAAVGKETLRLTAELRYDPYFLPAFHTILERAGGSKGDTADIKFNTRTEVRLKNTLEVALVLDNSGSMDDNGFGSGEPRIKLLKEAAKELVTALSKQAIMMKQVDKPVQFGVVPFAASVNVGPDNASADWMDKTGVSPIHHENFDWAGSMSFSQNSNKYAQKVGDVWYARGTGWGTRKDKTITRFSIYDWMRRRVPIIQGGKIVGYNYASIASWGGCVETRPYPYNVTDDPATEAAKETMFVPMFAPDETDNTSSSNRPANNNWRKDITNSSNDAKRQAYMPKYFLDNDEETRTYGLGEGPNASCTTTPITPLKDVTTTEGKEAVNNAIEAMVANGATNVPEGLAWGWRVVSGGAPFTEGRPDTERGVDKVVIVLTDGANTYYTPDSVRAQEYSGTYWRSGGNDLAGTKAIYSAFGYMKPFNPAYTHGRLYQGVTNQISKTNFVNSEYGKALNEQMASVCGNAKQKGVIVMTVALDLSSSNDAEKKQIEGMRACASESRFRADPNDPSKGAKLFWNATGATLSKAFKEIADELSNLRIVG
ncbi:MAG: hypothetical protein K5872_07985 [Rhizobiaceae bacterium]|nr:hypothetical protein [Rhizobiaceae bacterium]MCV0406152.1 hypothetical protein [Rhizobiaceae bacterium]